LGGTTSGQTKSREGADYNQHLLSIHFCQYQSSIDYALLCLVKRLNRVEGMLARLADDLVIIEHRAIDQNDAAGQTQAASRHATPGRGFTEVLDQLDGQQQADREVVFFSQSAQKQSRRIQPA